MEKIQKMLATAILNGLSKQQFRDWYEGKFVDYIEGCENAPSEAEIKKDIQQLFHL